MASEEVPTAEVLFSLQELRALLEKLHILSQYTHPSVQLSAQHTKSTIIIE
jgi:hypothetical protein